MTIIEQFRVPVALAKLELTLIFSRRNVGESSYAIMVTDALTSPAVCRRSRKTRRGGPMPMPGLPCRHATRAAPHAQGRSGCPLELLAESSPHAPAKGAIVRCRVSREALDDHVSEGDRPRPEAAS